MKNLESFWPQRIIPVVVIHRREDAVPLVEALMAANLNVVEITLRTDVAMDCIRILRKRFPDLILGGGTVFTRKQVHELQDLDVNYIMTPGLNEDVVGAARERDLPILPGIMTTTEVDRARALGLKHVKFFPAEAAGGARLLHAMTRPYVHTGMRFIPTGDVTIESLPSYLSIECVAAVGGNWFVSTELLEAQAFDEITRLARQAVSVTAKYALPIPPLPKTARDDL
jgi:2-dehydro-3-deoxyphosphogluconate aldolase / (4S)-4-hydroxy-2-oxoglutarate aldolase